MKMNGIAMRIGVTVLALGICLIAMQTSLQAQRVAGIWRVGWRSVAPVLGAPISIFSGLA
jgi:hypothetical protein